MRDIFSDIEQWVEKEQVFALATVIRTWGSSPRRAGSAMAVTPSMAVVGSVSGGCIEGAVIEEAMQIIETHVPKPLVFGVSDDSAWSVGLTCGGKVKVFVERFLAFDPDPDEQAVWAALRASLRENQPAILLSALSDTRSKHLLVYPDGRTVGSWNGQTAPAVDAALSAYATRQPQAVEVEGQEAFAHVFPRKDQLLIIGAAHIAVALVRMAKQMHFDTVLIDPRRVFSARPHTNASAAPSPTSVLWAASVPRRNARSASARPVSPTPTSPASTAPSASPSTPPPPTKSPSRSWRRSSR